MGAIARDGMLRIVGFLAPNKSRGIFALGVGGQIKALSEPIGRLDGVYELRDGTLLATDWNSGSLSSWTEKTGMQKLATGFKGPADFCVTERSGSVEMRELVDRDYIQVEEPVLPHASLGHCLRLGEAGRVQHRKKARLVPDLVQHVGQLAAPDGIPGAGVEPLGKVLHELLSRNPARGRLVSMNSMARAPSRARLYPRQDDRFMTVCWRQPGPPRSSRS